MKKRLKCHIVQNVRFLPDRYLIGICPKCGKETKGDQCDCGYLIEDTKEIIDPKCSICGSKPEWRKTKHLFLDLPRFKEDLKKIFIYVYGKSL